MIVGQSIVGASKWGSVSGCGPGHGNESTSLGKSGGGLDRTEIESCLNVREHGRRLNCHWALCRERPTNLSVTHDLSFWLRVLD